ncbi:hypothetical protein [Pseudomonas sp. S1(2024)]|uniref:hypothetical protein n=1 Tax=Pseudomonas sp. S1(2024) TaxID=3390191 RepID=UPI0039791342
MHKVFNDILLELKAIEDYLESAMPANVPLGQAVGHWGVAAVSRSNLVGWVASISHKLSLADPDEPGNDLPELTEAIAALQWARGNTLPQLVSQNATASLPAFSITLQALERVLLPYVEPNHKQALENSKALRRAAAQIRGMESRLRDLSPKTTAIQTMVEGIERAYEAADQLPADLELLSEARHKVESISVDAEKDRAQILTVRDEIMSLKANLDAVSAQAGEVLTKCESVYSSATSVGLAAAFTERSASLDKSMWLWLVGLISALAVGGYVGTGQLQTLTQLLTQPGGASGALIILNITLAVLSVGAPVWFAWLATKQVGQRFRLSEDYAFKASISRAYDGYSREAGRIDPQLEAKLLHSALSRLDEQPLRLVEGASYGSPWHELLASEVVKDAMKSIPNFASQMKDFASDALGKLKSRPENVAANSAQVIVSPGEEKPNSASNV